MMNALSPDTKPWVELGRCLGVAAAALGNNSKEGITVTAYGEIYTLFFSILKVLTKNCSRLNSIFVLLFFKIRLGSSCESSAWQMIHIKCQALF